MKITDLQIIPFRVSFQPFRHGQILEPAMRVQTLTRIQTDQGLEGYYLGGHNHGDLEGLPPDDRRALLHSIKPMLLGQDPFDREKIWHWMWTRNLQENLLSVVDMLLWDLQARAYDLPLYKLLGGARDKVKAYASTYPNMATPEGYAAHAVQCRERGYTHYKIHPYYFYDPVTGQPDHGRPSHTDQDIAVCEAVREAVGDDMVLSFDPWGTYRTYEDAIKVGRALERLGFYWYEHPMPEYRVQSYVKLCQELTIPVLSPEIAAGSLYTRADWILRGASDMSRIDVLRGGVTGVKKMAAICEAFGVRCEIHMSGFANLQCLGGISEDVSEYYERGLEAPGLDYDAPPPYLHAIGDPMDSEGYVHLPQAPGMGYQLDWDYIRENRLPEDE